MTLRLLATIFVMMAILLPPPVRADSATIMGVEQARNAAINNSLILVDIRRPEEWQQSGVGDVAHALDMTNPRFVKDLMKLRNDNPDARLGLICASGSRSRVLARYLVRNGIKGVVDVSAGMHGRSGWLARKLPVKPAPTK